MIAKQSPRRGFTLSQLVVGSAVLAFLLGLFFPSVVKTRDAANRANCQNNLKQIGVAINNYASAYRDKLPPLMDYENALGVNWMPFWYSQLPYIEQDAIFKRAYKTGAGWNNNNHLAVILMMLCPSDMTHRAGLCTSGAENWAATSYAPVYQLFGAETFFNPDHKVFVSRGKYTIANHADGTSNQVAIVERFSSFPRHGWSNAMLYPMDSTYFGMNPYGSLYGYWGLGTPQTSATLEGPRAANPYRPNTVHATCQVLRLDGSVVSISRDIKSTTWTYLCTPDDGNVVGDY